MTDLRELVRDWAAHHWPDLLEDETLFDGLCLFLLEVIDFSILAARRQVYREIRQEKEN